MDLRKIKTLLQLMNENGLAEMELEEEGIKIKFSKYSSHSGVTTTVSPIAQNVLPTAAPQPSSSDDALAEDEGETITSPMPGTFYTAPSPELPPYVKVGDTIDEESVVCIIEAMKVMNEIKGEISGKIVEIFVNNGDPVEYGQPLFRVV